MLKSQRFGCIKPGAFPLSGQRASDRVRLPEGVRLSVPGYREPVARIFALTGGIGSGKSTVSAHFTGRGLPVVDADALSRIVVEPGSLVLARIAQAFGPGIVNDDGQLDRKKLAGIVFSDRAELERLQAITHPAIRALARERFAELSRLGEPLICYEIPLLFETDLGADYRPIVVVWAPEAVRIARVRDRDHSNEGDVRKRIAAQLDLAEKARRADWVIDNTGSLEQTFREANRVLRAIAEQLGIDPSRYGFEPG